MLLRLIDGDFAQGLHSVTLKSPPDRGAEFSLEGTHNGAPRSDRVREIDGVLFDDPASEAADRIVLWMHTDRAIPAVTVPESSAARSVWQIASMYGCDTSQTLPFQLAKLSGEQVQLHIPGGMWRVQDIDEVFFPKLLVVIDEEGTWHLPDYPIRPLWQSAVREVRCTTEKSADGRILSATYSVALRGLSTPAVRAFGQNDMAPMGSAGASDPFRIMVWPNTNLATWRFFCVDLGRQREDDWTNAHWGLFTTVRKPSSEGEQPSSDPDRFPDAARAYQCRNDSMLPHRVFPCRAASAQRNQNRTSELVELRGGNSRREVAQDRPELLCIERRDQQAGGVFKLLPPMDVSVQLRTTQPTVGIDIGTSNSCVSVDDGTSPVYSVDLDMTRPDAQFVATDDPRTDLVFVKVGSRANRLTTIEPWLPGLEGPGHKPDALKAATALTQIPTLVLLLDPQAKTPADIDLKVVEAMLPIRDVIVPPPDYLRTFGGPLHHVSGAFDKLKWLSRSGDPQRSGIFLIKYLESIFLFVAAKMPCSGIQARLSYPLSFEPGDRMYLLRAAKKAAEAVKLYTGVAINPTLHADEGRCIISAHIRNSQASDKILPLSVVCDIGGGSIDIAVATYSAKERVGLPHGKVPASLVFLAADSVRFGANLLFERLFRDLKEAIVPDAATRSDREIYAREMFKQRVRQLGYSKLLASVPGQRSQALTIVDCYFALVREYLARTIAATIRNPYRLGATIYRFNPRAAAQQAVVQDGMWGPETDEGRVTMSDLLTVPTPPGQPPRCWMQLKEVTIDLLFTGNGWRSFEAFSAGALADRSQEMGAFVTALSRRVNELVNAPVDGEAAEVTKAFAGTKAARANACVGLQRGATRVLKEALADSILGFDGQRGTGDDADQASEPLSACNGFTEQAPAADMWDADAADGCLPWYAMVGSRELAWRGDIYARIGPPDSEMQFGSVVLPLRDGTLPPLPTPDLQDIGKRLELNLEFGSLYRRSIPDVTAAIAPAGHGNSRSRSLLSVMYEKVLAPHIFFRGW